MLKRVLKRGMSFTLIASLALGLAACGTKESQNKEKITSNAQTEFEDDEIFRDLESGVVFYLPKEYQDKGVSASGMSTDVNDHAMVRLAWEYKPVTDKLLNDFLDLPDEERTPEAQEKFYEEYYKHSKCLIDVTLVEEEEYDQLISQGKKPGDISYWPEAEELDRKYGYVYLVAIPNNTTEGMSEEEKALYDACHLYMQTVKENIQLNEQEVSNELPEEFPMFSTTDLNGNSIDNAIFSNADLTVLNIWGTFCGPCIDEMPELGKWAKEMPENVQLIGLVADIEGEEDTKHLQMARDYLTAAEADFTNMMVNRDFDRIMNWVTGVPTTIFVDKSGNIVGEPIVGANVEGYKAFVEEYLNEQ